MNDDLFSLYNNTHNTMQLTSWGRMNKGSSKNTP